ncbi:acyl-CoA dehydrogenase family protein [uncultured Draconibacterium sp.]|uniref:acyl-CoA dehydrogenase family protein n=1 Tax=uncultured Draconibacterium sp. TaxID=1573823 RepID=UPI0025F420C5|nr:acyl-CoA dehydrogenase family protein [uncultured Draconibacterium sp.]
MNVLLSKNQLAAQASYAEFFGIKIAPLAAQIDREEQVPESIIKQLSTAGYLGAILPEACGGLNLDPVTFGLLNEEAGKACTSVRSLLTVQNMVGAVLNRWGSEPLKNKFLPQLTSGTRIAAFALTEPGHGSDASSIEMQVTEEGSFYVLNGTKKWISFAQIAGLFLVFGKLNGKICSLLVPSGAPGLSVKPINGLLGARGCMLGELHFKNVRVPQTHLVGNVGFGLFPVAFTGLDIGRYSIAWGCVGMAQACMESSKLYTKNRKQFGEPIANNQLVKRMLSEMAVDIKAARLLCFSAGKYMEAKKREAFGEILAAKYMATKMLKSASEASVQLHGANGLSNEYPVERFYRDSKIMQLIEGSDQMLQLMISKYN